MKLTPEQKAYLKTIDSEKKRKKLKLDFKVANKFNEMLSDFNEDLEINNIEVNYEYVCGKQSQCSILKELIKSNPNDIDLGREVRRMF